MKLWRVLLLTPVAVSACSRQPDLMPMHIGRSITYQVSFESQKRVEPVTVTRELPIAGSKGFELSGPMGSSRLVWKSGVLLASQTANAWFDPAIPLVAADSIDRTWQGRVNVLGVKTLASATLTHKKDKLDIGPRTIETTLAELTVKLPRGTIVLDSWFQPGVGLVRQEQRTNEILVVRMEMLGGPKE